MHGQGIGPAHWDEDHLLCSSVVLQAARERILALLMLSSSDIAIRVEVIPVWPLDAANGGHG